MPCVKAIGSCKCFIKCHITFTKAPKAKSFKTSKREVVGNVSVSLYEKFSKEQNSNCVPGGVEIEKVMRECTLRSSGPKGLTKPIFKNKNWCCHFLCSDS